VGASAARNITTGVFNTIVGGLAGDALTDADHNVAVGEDALGSDTLGSRSVAVGRTALFNQNFTTATDTYNVGVGYAAGFTISTGIRNNFVGGLAGYLTTTGSNNIAMGLSALEGNQIGSKSIAIGNSSLAVQNPATALEMYNVAVGDQAGVGVTTGRSNTLIGHDAGSHDVNLSTGSNNVIVGAFSDTSANSSDNAIVLGYNVSGAADFTTLGNGSSDIRAAHGVASWATVSDERYKKDITDSTVGLSFINALKPRTFNYKTKGELPDTFRAYEEGSSEVYKSDKTQHGFIAQEVKTAIDAASGIADGFKLWDERPDSSQEIAETALIPMLVKAIQELSAEIETLKSGG